MRPADGLSKRQRQKLLERENKPVELEENSQLVLPAAQQQTQYVSPPLDHFLGVGTRLLMPHLQ